MRTISFWKEPSSDTHIVKRRLKIPKGQSDLVNRKRTENTMVKRRTTIYKSLVSHVNSPRVFSGFRVGRSIVFCLGNDHLTWRWGGGYGFFLKKIFWFPMLLKNIFWFWWRKKKSDSEFLSYNLMLNSGEKKNILTLALSKKKILNETKNHNPPPPHFKLIGLSLRSLWIVVYRLSFLLWPWYCLSFFDLRLLTISLVSSNLKVFWSM